MQKGTPMTSKLRFVEANIGALRSGDRVFLMSPQGYVVFQGEVDDLSPLFDLVWVRNERTGERKLFIGAEQDIRLANPD